MTALKAGDVVHYQGPASQGAFRVLQVRKADAAGVEVTMQRIDQPGHAPINWLLKRDELESGFMTFLGERAKMWIEPGS